MKCNTKRRGIRIAFRGCAVVLGRPVPIRTNLKRETGLSFIAGRIAIREMKNPLPSEQTKQVRGVLVDNGAVAR